MPDPLQSPQLEARASPDLEALLPRGVVAAEMSGPADPRLLLASEAVHLGASVPKRVGEFAAGRLCARRALSAFGLGAAAIPVAADRTPIWPTGMVGSISHTAGLCIAAVGASSVFRGLGVDCEVVAQVGSDLWDTLFTRAELSWLDAVPGESRPTAAAFLFSAKEAFYKCQFPLTGEWLDFKDVEVDAVDWQVDHGAFRIRAARPVAAEAIRVGQGPGRYRLRGGIVMTAIALPA